MMEKLDETRLWIVKEHGIVIFVSTLILVMWTAAAPGQLGMGDRKGVVQQRLKPHIVRLSGTLRQIETHPCENTTGKAELGTHLILKDKDDQELNIHLGPASEVSEIVKRLAIGQGLDLLGFRTDKMPPNHYVAQTLILPNHIVRLRGSDLRPYWSDNKTDGQPASSMVSTTGKLRMSEPPRSSPYYPQYWRRRYFQDGSRPRWRRRCHGRGRGRRWN